jgi:hypothetical protein
MMAVIIIACEVGFWVLVLAGLIARYMFRQPKLGWSLLLLTPVVDLLLLIVTALDLRNGAEASFVHGIAAIYIGVSIAYGHKMIGWADKQFAYRFANGPAPSKPPKYGADHANHERRGWLSHLLAWIIGAATLYGIILFVGDGAQTEPLMQCIRVWGIILVIDFAYSFSFTLWPRKAKKPIG